MKLQYQLNFDDFREAQETHAVASQRPKESASVASAVWQIATAAIMITMAMILDPWTPSKTPWRWVATWIVMPAIPWVMILGYLLRFQLVSARGAASFIKPWEGVRGQNVKPFLRARPGRRTLVFGCATFVLGIVLIAMSMFEHQCGTRDDLGNELLFGYGAASLPWGIYVIWAAIVQMIQRGRPYRLAWEQQPRLHEPYDVEIDHTGVAFVLPNVRTEYKWVACAGIVESANFFLLYVSRTAFEIIPKRAFAEQEMIVFRNITAGILAPQTPGFPVVQISDR